MRAAAAALDGGHLAGGFALGTAAAFVEAVVAGAIRAWDADADRGWGKRTPIEAALEALEQAFLNEALGACEGS